MQTLEPADVPTEPTPIRPGVTVAGAPVTMWDDFTERLWGLMRPASGYDSPRWRVLYGKLREEVKGMRDLAGMAEGQAQIDGYEAGKGDAAVVINGVAEAVEREARYHAGMRGPDDPIAVTWGEAVRVVRDHLRGA